MTRRKLPPPIRQEILTTAISHTVGDRDVEYGPPIHNLTDCAGLFSAYIIARFRGQTVDENNIILSAQDVAWLNVLQKMARTMSGNVKADTYEDSAAYSAIAGECAFMEIDE